MGTWALGPFENDAAADFLDQATDSPGDAVTDALNQALSVPYIDVDDAGAAWAAAELVALALGRGEPKKQIVREIVANLQPRKEDRVLALRVLARLANQKRCELASLWHEGKDGERFDALLEELHARLGAQ